MADIIVQPKVLASQNPDTYNNLIMAQAQNATNVTTNINGNAISNIFESDGITVKNATNANSVPNILDTSGEGNITQVGLYAINIKSPANEYYTLLLSIENLAETYKTYGVYYSGNITYGVTYKNNMITMSSTLLELGYSLSYVRLCIQY